VNAFRSLLPMWTESALSSWTAYVNVGPEWRACPCVCVCVDALNQDCSVSLVPDYGMNDPVIGVRSPAEARGFSSNLCVQTGSGNHPAFCTEGIGVPSPGVKRGQGVTLTTHPHLVSKSRMSRSYTSPLKRLHGVYYSLTQTHTNWTLSSSYMIVFFNVFGTSGHDENCYGPVPTELCWRSLFNLIAVLWL
jgi:hypothetical protein